MLVEGKTATHTWTWGVLNVATIQPCALELTSELVGQSDTTRGGEPKFPELGSGTAKTLPLLHAGAHQFGVMGPLVNDMTTVIERRFRASAYW